MILKLRINKNQTNSIPKSIIHSKRFHQQAEIVAMVFK